VGVQVAAHEWRCGFCKSAASASGSSHALPVPAFAITGMRSCTAFASSFASVAMMAHV
jgi:hypothetical protein